jgi:hypothetical protein
MPGDEIDQMLRHHYAGRAADDTGVARVMNRLAEPLPQQKRATRWPQIFLDWQFAPAWPRLAALACCALLGFAVGATGFDRLGKPLASSGGSDLASIAFEPEALTGARP